MAFDEVLKAMQKSIQTALDDLASPRSLAKTKTRALQSLERQLGTACFVTDNDSEAKDAFMALQHTFECNVPSHLLPWIALSTQRLEVLTSKSPTDSSPGSDLDSQASQLTLSLSLIQGVLLMHEPSKYYLGRISALQILLDLLLASRHLPLASDNAESNVKSSPTPPHLTAVVLDTLLCILVDSSAALRAFEEANGVQAIVKILKRAGTPREVRMKCLEFLYFYLLDETPSHELALKSPEPIPTPPPTAPATPATPIRPPKPYLSSTPMRPTSRYGSSTFSFTSSISGGLSISDSSHSSSSRSTSGSSTHSFSSTSSNASSSTAASSVASASPVKEAGSLPLISPIKALPKSPIKRLATPHNSQRNVGTPPNSPPLSAGGGSIGSGGNKFPQLRSMMMLKKEVDYVPQSPKKVGVMGLGVGRPTGHQKSLSMSTASSSTSSSGLSGQLSQRTRSDGLDSSKTLVETSETAITSPISRDISLESIGGLKEKERPSWKTTEEKKELLGTMLGNVDALVEGVRKAGIWGLG